MTREELLKEFGWLGGQIKTPFDLASLGRFFWFREHILPPPASMLDVGTGHGQLIMVTMGNFINRGFEHTQPRGTRIEALDINPEFVEQWKLIYPGLKVHQCDIGKEPWPVESDTFDNVIASEVFEHMPESDWPHALSEAWRACKSQVLISVPYYRFAGDMPENDRTFHDAPMGPIGGDHQFRPGLERWSQWISELMPGAIHEFQTLESEPNEISFVLARIIKKPWW